MATYRSPGPIRVSRHKPIVHYLFTGSYETPPANTSVTRQNHSGLRAALLVFVATCSHDLHDLQQLAIGNIENQGDRLNLTELLETIDNDFPRLSPHTWVHNYLCSRAKEAFDKVHKVSSDKSEPRQFGFGQIYGQLRHGPV